MTARSKANKAHSLISYYELLYKDRYGARPVMNRYRDKWGFESMVDDLGEVNARKVMDFYFSREAPHGHPLIDLFRNYDSIYELMVELANDEENRKQLRAETKKRVEEWQRQKQK